MTNTDGAGIVLVVSVCSVLVLVVTAVLEHHLLKTSVAKRLDEFDAKIRAEADKALRQYEGSIHQKNRVNLELVTLKGEVFQRLYKYVADIIEQGNSYRNANHVRDIYTKNKQIIEVFDEFVDFFNENGVIFTESLYDEVTQFLSKFEEQILFLKTNSNARQTNQEMIDMKIEKAKETWGQLEPAFKKLMGSVRREFNSLYHETDSSSSVWIK